MTSPMPILNMTWLIQKEIFKHMTLNSRISLRNCSLRMCQKVDEIDVCNYRSVIFHIDKDSIRLTLVTESGEEAILNYCQNPMKNEKESFGDDYTHRAVTAFVKIVSNPRVTVRIFKFSIYQRVSSIFDAKIPKLDGKLSEVEAKIAKEDVLGRIRRQMEAFGAKMNVKRFVMKESSSEDEIMAFLELLRPRILEEIDIHPATGTHFERVAASEQWNQAKKLSIANSHLLPIGATAHFHEVRIEGRLLTRQYVDEVIEAATRLGDQFVKFEVGNYAFVSSSTQRYIRELGERADWPTPDNRLAIGFAVTLSSSSEFFLRRKK